MTLRLLGENRKLFKFFRLSIHISKIDLDTERVPPNMEICPESLGAMLQYLYIWNMQAYWWFKFNTPKLIIFQRIFFCFPRKILHVLRSMKKDLFYAKLQKKNVSLY